jgi:hypothetical protein
MISSSQAIRSLGSGPTGTPALLWPVAVVDTRRRRRSRRRRTTTTTTSRFCCAAAAAVGAAAALLLRASTSLKPRTWFGLLNNVAADSVQIQHETQQGQNVNSVFCFWP